MNRSRLLTIAIIFTVVAGVTLILLGTTQTNSATTTQTSSYSAKAGNFNVGLVMSPAPAAFSATTFDITLTDEKGVAVSDANVSLDLTMPTMYMPANRPAAQSIGNGKYRASGRFTMRGGWQIAVIIDRSGQKQTAIFQLGL